MHTFNQGTKIDHETSRLLANKECIHSSKVQKLNMRHRDSLQARKYYLSVNRLTSSGVVLYQVMLGKVLQSKLESTAKVTEVEGTGVGNGGKDGDVRVTITSLAMPSEAERGYPCDRSLTLPAQTTEGSSCMHLTSLDSGHLDHETLSCQWTASPPEEVHCDGVKVDCA
eukprot:c22398_g1_i4 orf=424-930(+)